MRRGKPLRRRVGLARGAPLRRASRLRARPLPADEAGRRRHVRYVVFTRDGWACQVSPGTRRARLAATVPGGDPGACFGLLTVHHLRKASAGGAYQPDNLLSLCAAHNSWVENRPLAATVAGLVDRTPTPKQPS